jgi:hypothetical protein
MLLTTRNWCVSLPAASSSGKYFWLAFIVRIRHSCGTPRNSFSKLHTSTFGRSTKGGHFVEQGIILDGAHTAAHTFGRGCELADDLGPALGKAGDDGAIGTQAVGIGIGIGERHRVDAGFETVAMRVAPRLQAQRVDRHHVGAMQRNQPVRRAHEAHARPARQLAIGL